MVGNNGFRFVLGFAPLFLDLSFYFSFDFNFRVDKFFTIHFVLKFVYICFALGLAIICLIFASILLFRVRTNCFWDLSLFFKCFEAGNNMSFVWGSHQLFLGFIPIF